MVENVHFLLTSRLYNVMDHSQKNPKKYTENASTACQTHRNHRPPHTMPIKVYLVTLVVTRDTVLELVHAQTKIPILVAFLDNGSELDGTHVKPS